MTLENALEYAIEGSYLKSLTSGLIYQVEDGEAFKVSKLKEPPTLLEATGKWMYCSGEQLTK